MHALEDNTTQSLGGRVADTTHPPANNLATKWARGRREVTPWAYPHLAALAVVRLAVGFFLVGVGAMLLSRGHDAWAAVPLVGAALCLAIGSLDGAAARAARPRS